MEIKIELDTLEIERTGKDQITVRWKAPSGRVVSERVIDAWFEGSTLTHTGLNHYINVALPDDTVLGGFIGELSLNSR